MPGSQSSAFLEMSAVICAFCKLPPLCSNHSQKNGSPIPNTIYLENGLYPQGQKKKKRLGCKKGLLSVAMSLLPSFPPLKHTLDP